ncbi:hypothetical protein FRC01_012740 [Tulasnella sp. 417]|nr:hypothetical protein FRC01_012740 [Tulasnella sp. 417]
MTPYNTHPATQPDLDGGRVPSPVVLEEARTLTPQMDEESGAHAQQNAQTDDGQAQHWTAKEVHVIPDNNMWIIVPGLMLSIFLAALDQTVVAIALPTIVQKLGTSDGYAWVGSAYMLTSGATVPFWGVLSDLTGRKPLIFFGMILFMAASALCGAAQNMKWLIAARAVQGIGGGALVAMTQIIVGDVVSLEQRAQFQGLIGATFGISAVLGPVLGGLLAQLNLNPVPRKSMREHMKNFDFIGLFFITSAVVCLLVGFTLSENGWSSPAVISLIAVAPVLFGFGVLNEFLTKRRPILPPRLFRTRTTLILLFSVFLHAFAFFAANYYLPLYFQIRGASIIVAALLMIPFSLSSSILSIVSGWYISTTKQWRPTLWFGWAISLLGLGLMIDLDHTSNHVKEAIYTFITGFGIGCLFQTPLIAILSAMPQKDMALVTSALQLTRLLGGTIGISAGGAIYLSTLRHQLDNIPGYDGVDVPNGDLINLVGSLPSLQPDELRQSIISAYAESLSYIWIVCTPMIGVGFLLVLCVREYGMKRIIIKPGEKPPADGESTPTTVPATSSEESSPTSSPIDEKDPGAATAPELPPPLPISVASEQRTTP